MSFVKSQTTNLGQPVTTDMTPFTRIIENSQGKLMQIKGFEFDIPGNETSVFWLKWDVDIEFIGGRAFSFDIDGNSWGNFNSNACMDIVDKDNVFGYGENFVIAEFINNVPLKILQKGCVVESTTPVDLLKELYMRVTVTNGDIKPLKVCLAMRYFV